MGELKTSTEEILVHLVCPGVGARDYRLAVGATLADLLRLLETSMVSQAVFVDGLTPEEARPLHEGAVVTILPRPGNGAVREPWRATISAFRDEVLFQEYLDAVKVRRDEVNVDEEAPHG
jgi:hypothetical protein